MLAISVQASLPPHLVWLARQYSTSCGSWLLPFNLVHLSMNVINPLIATLKLQSNGPSYSSTVIGTLAVDGWAVTFGTAMSGLDRAAAHPGTTSLHQM